MRIGGIISCVIALVLLPLSVVSTSWFEGTRGRSHVSTGPVFAERCFNTEPCKRDFLMERIDSRDEVWAAAGLGFAGVASLVMLLLVVTIILSAVKSRGGAQVLGWLTMVFGFFVLTSGMSFLQMKPSKVDLPTGSGVYLMVAAALAAMVGCALTALGVGPMPAAAGAAPFPQGQPMPGYPNPQPGQAPTPSPNQAPGASAGYGPAGYGPGGGYGPQGQGGGYGPQGQGGGYGPGGGYGHGGT